MPLVVGVTFRKVGKVYYFDPGDLQLNEGDFIIAETARGVEFGEVVLEPREVPEEELVAPLKNVIRVATGDDLEREAANREREAHAFEICERKIAEHNLPMKLLEAEYAFDGSQVTLSFSAEGRVDFRELVKDVAGTLKVKVQLHQIGVRDEAKLIGGYGTCGRSLCCATFLSSFDPISMKMAKDQSLFLNPAKFSGVCGKLMCCLRYEHEYYKYAQKQLPCVGAIIPLEQGQGKVIDVNVISNVITVQTEDDVQVHIPASKIALEGLCRRHGIGCNMSDPHCEPMCMCGGEIKESESSDEPAVANDDEVADEVEPTVDEIADMLSDEIETPNEVAVVTQWRVPGDETQTHVEELPEENSENSDIGDKDKQRPKDSNGKSNGKQNRSNSHGRPNGHSRSRNGNHGPRRFDRSKQKSNKPNPEAGSEQ